MPSLFFIIGDSLEITGTGAKQHNLIVLPQRNGFWKRNSFFQVQAGRAILTVLHLASKTFKSDLRLRVKFLHPRGYFRMKPLVTRQLPLKLVIGYGCNHG